VDAPGLGFNLLCSQRELPILLADRIGVFIYLYFSYRERR
jgi:hypothetical protein